MSPTYSERIVQYWRSPGRQVIWQDIKMKGYGKIKRFVSSLWPV